MPERPAPWRAPPLPDVRCQASADLFDRGHNPFSIRGQKRASHNGNRLHIHKRYTRYNRADLAGRANFDRAYLQIQSPRGRFVVSQGRNLSRVSRVKNHGNTADTWHDFLQKLKPLAGEFLADGRRSSDISSWSGQACGNAELHWIAAQDHDDWNSRCCFTHRLDRRCSIAIDYVNFLTHQSASRLGKKFIPSHQGTIVYTDVLALDITLRVQTFTKRGDVLRRSVRIDSQQPDPRHTAQLLRVRSERRLHRPSPRR